MKKDEIMSDPVVLDSVFANAHIEDRIRFFDLVGQFYELRMPLNERHLFEKNRIQILLTLDKVSYLAYQVEGMVEKFLENNIDAI